MYNLATCGAYSFFSSFDLLESSVLPSDSLPCRWAG